MHYNPDSSEKILQDTKYILNTDLVGACMWLTKHLGPEMQSFFLKKSFLVMKNIDLITQVAQRDYI